MTISTFCVKCRLPLPWMILLIFSIFQIPESTMPAFNKKETGAIAIAMGQAVVAINEFPMAIYYNPAALHRFGHANIILTYQNYYGLRELNEVDALINFSIAGNGLSVALNRFGNNLYRETQITAGGCLKIVEGCTVGLSVQYYLISIKNYGQDAAFGLNIGLLYKLLPYLSVGALATNINSPDITRSDEKLPQTFTMGFAYEPIESLMLSFDLYRDLKYSLEYRAGFSYRIINPLYIRGGIEDQAGIYSLGVGIFTVFFNLDYAIKIHHILGASHIFSVTFHL